ncbi:MAG TPA: MFS transporter [Spirochaetota bacterium]|nr:MFS transporter [Spirochaetota bacterium]HOL56564.1 MFS transporter [Spirochaetota bacterium]HPP04903.1 MFS transporter [Spirochaetota bacterium]
MEQNNDYKKKALFLIFIFGIISLLGDVIYEGARSIYGPFTKTISMDIALVGFITGLAEFLGYFIRIISGYLSDKTKSPWIFTILGYGMLISIPLLSLTGIWQIVSIFIICERIGKAIRSPAKDTILSQATKRIGTGLGFAIHEAMDQIGAFLGPLLFSLLLIVGKNENSLSQYQFGFKILWIPFIILMISVIFAYLRFPNPEIFETQKQQDNQDKLTKQFWLYSIFSFITTLGFTSFVILGYYFKEKNLIKEESIPFFYSIAMIVDAIVALIVGKIYDNLKSGLKNEKAGLYLLIIIPLFTLILPFFVFTKNYILIITGIIMWGIVMGTHETIMKSVIADITHLKKRGTGYGIFNSFYGLSMFLGSFILGLLYKININFIIFFIIIIELLSLLIYYILIKSLKNR